MLLPRPCYIQDLWSVHQYSLRTFWENCLTFECKTCRVKFLREFRNFLLSLIYTYCVYILIFWCIHITISFILMNVSRIIMNISYILTNISHIIMNISHTFMNISYIFMNISYICYEFFIFLLKNFAVIISINLLYFYSYFNFQLIMYQFY